MKKVFKLILTYLLLFFDRMFGKRGIVILEYHRVSDKIRPEDVHSIFPEEFYSQIRYLVDSGYKIVSLNEVRHLLLNGFNKKEKIVALTFDDGHKDNIEFAYPILKEFNICATIFVVSDYVGKSGWMDETGSLKNTQSKIGQWWDLLSWEELAEINDFFIIESHGKSHQHLKNLTEEELYMQLRDPKIQIEKMLNIDSKFFCYPYGEFNNNIIQQLKSMTYLAACSSMKGINSPLVTDIWQLNRNEVGRGLSKVEFQLLLTNAIRTYDKISRWFNK